MAAQDKTLRSNGHSVGMREGYERMLRASGAHGRFVTLGTGRRVHVVEAGDGVPIVHLHGNNTSALSHLMLLETATGVRSYLVDRPGMGLSDRATSRAACFATLRSGSSTTYWTL